MQQLAVVPMLRYSRLFQEISDFHGGSVLMWIGWWRRVLPTFRLSLLPAKRLHYIYTVTSPRNRIHIVYDCLLDEKQISIDFGVELRSSVSW